MLKIYHTLIKITRTWTWLKIELNWMKKFLQRDFHNLPAHSGGRSGCFIPGCCFWVWLGMEKQNVDLHLDLHDVETHVV